MMSVVKSIKGLSVVLAMGLVASACADDYEPTIICHNANCQEPAAPEEDSTIETLAISLDLIDDETGRPPIDGMEIDTFWWGEEERCLMAHDLDDPERAVDAEEAVALINQSLRDRVERAVPLTRSADRYLILIELKGHVAEAKDVVHDAVQREQHASCGIELAQMAMQSADDNGYGVEIVFMSFAPEILVALHDHGQFADLRQAEHPVRLSALHGLPRPLDTQTVPLDEYPDDIGIDLISVHPHWTRDADLQAYDSRGFELGFWSFNLGPETLGAISSHRPSFITTSQAPSLSAWLRR